MLVMKSTLSSEAEVREEVGKDQVRTAVVASCYPIRDALRMLLDSEAELIAALDRFHNEARALGSEKPSRRATIQPAGLRYLHRIAIPRAGGVTLYLKLSEVHFFKAANQYIEIHADGGRYLIRQSMQSLERELNPHLFLRIHRSAIVNLRCVRELQSASATHRWAILTDGNRVRVSPVLWQRLQEALLEAL